MSLMGGDTVQTRGSPSAALQIFVLLGAAAESLPVFAVLFPSFSWVSFQLWQCLLCLLSSVIKTHTDICLSHAWLGASSLWNSARFPGFAWESEPQLFRAVAPEIT